MLCLPYAVLLATAVSAISTPEIPQENHVKMDFAVLRGSSRSSASPDQFPALVKKDGSSVLTLTNEQTYYAASLKIGSRGASNNVILDTGSSDLWVMASNVSCSSRRTSKRSVDLDDYSVFSHRRILDFEMETDEGTNANANANANAKRADSTVVVSQFATATATTSVIGIGGGSGSGSASARVAGGASCTSSGSFDTSASNSFRYNATAPQFAISYGDGTYARGFWGRDYINTGSSNVSDCSFAIVDDTTSDTGVFGIGFAQLETTYSSSSSAASYTYENFPLRLKSTGAINKVAYSLYLDTSKASSGSVLFGAVDHAKYSGQLQTVPIINIYSRYYSRPIRFDIVLNSMTLSSSAQNISVSTTPIPALLDSGTTLTYLPSAIVGSLVSSLGGTLTSSGFYSVKCSYNTRSAYLVFNFSGVRIRVPLADLILSQGSQCYLGVLAQSADRISGLPYAILGDNFLRNAYIVYNLEDYEISLAQVQYSSSSSIDVISSSIPSAVRAPGYSSTAVASSVSSGTSQSSLSPSSTRKSDGSSAFNAPKSSIFAVVGAVLLFAF